MKLFSLVKKNFKILFRNKLALLALLLGPLIILLIAGFAFNNSVSYDIQVGTYSLEYSDLATKFVENLDDDFEITDFPDESSCVDAVKYKGYHACIIIPEDLEISSGNSSIVDMYFDNSRVNIVSAIKQSVYSSLESTSSEVTVGITTSLVNSLVFVEKELIKDKVILSKGFSSLNSLKKSADESKQLAYESKVDFKKDDLSISLISGAFDGLESDYDDAVDIAKDALNEFDSFASSIEDSTNVSPATISDINIIIDDFDDLISNLTSNNTNVAALDSIISNLNLEIAALSKDISSAKGKVDQVGTGLTKITSGLSEVISKLNIVKSSFDSVLLKLKGNDVRDANSIASPITLRDNEIVSGSKLNYMLPSLLILVLMFVTIITSATQVTNEKISRAKTRMGMTPSSFFINTLSTFVTIFIINVVQILLILTMLQLVFKLDIFSVIFPVLLVLFLVVIFFGLLGIAVGYLFKTEHTVMLGSVSVASFFFIVSDLILPLETLPVKLISVMNYTPFVVATDVLRKVIFFDVSLLEVQKSIFVLIGLSLSILIIITLISNISGFLRKSKAKRSSELVVHK